MKKLFRKRDTHNERLSSIEKSTADFLIRALDEEDESKFIHNLEEILKSHAGTISTLLDKDESLNRHFTKEVCSKCNEETLVKFNNIILGCKCDTEA